MRKGNLFNLDRQHGIDHRLTGVQLWLVSLIAVLSLTAIGIAVFVAEEVYFHPDISNLSQIESLMRFGFAVPVFVGAVIGLVVAFRRQHVLEAAHGLTESQHFTSRFESCIRLVSDAVPQVRAAGIYSLIQLADDWAPQRQVCVSLLCSHVRQASARESEDNDEHISTIIEAVQSHLQPNGIWQGLHFDMRGAVFSHFNLSGIVLSSGTTLDLSGVRVEAKAMIALRDVVLDGGSLKLSGFHLRGGLLDISSMTIKSGELFLRDLRMFGGVLVFDGLKLKGGRIEFWETECENSQILARNCEFLGGQLEFGPSHFKGVTELHFERSKFLAGIVDISNSGSSNGHIFLDDCEFESVAQPILWLTPPKTASFSGLPTNLPNAVKFQHRRVMNYKEIVPGSSERRPVGMWIIEENPSV